MSMSASASRAKTPSSPMASISRNANARPCTRPGRWSSTARPRTLFWDRACSTSGMWARHGVRSGSGVATDIAGGTSYSLLQTLRRGVQDCPAEGLHLQRLRRVLPRHPGQCARPSSRCRDRHARCRTLGRCRRPRPKGDAGAGCPPGALGEPGGHAVRADDAGATTAPCGRSTSREERSPAGIGATAKACPMAGLDEGLRNHALQDVGTQMTRPGPLC